MKLYRSFLSYCRKVWKIVAVFLLFGGIFAGVLYLYNIHPEPVGYAMLLCMLIGVIFLVIGFGIYVRKERELDNLRDAALLKEWKTFYLPRGLEQKYCDAICSLQAEYWRLEKEQQSNMREMTDYFTMWVHQVKTPIAAMRLLLQSHDTQYRGAMEAELFKIEQYVEMVLGYLRTENISSDLVLESCDLDKIVRTALKKYARLFALEKLSLAYEPLKCQVLTDEKWLGFVLEQLLSNALKYTKMGQISIYMKPGEEKTLVVEDTGIGISAQDLPRVFERGYTGCNGREGRHSTGIGLYSAKRILDKLGHGIAIESEMGQGTRVYLDLAREELTLY